MDTKISKQTERNMLTLITNRQGPNRIAQMLSSMGTAFMVGTLIQEQT
jgi:Mg2+ and Co2+ transporter CorA